MFSFMDGYSGYNQIRMTTKDAKKNIQDSIRKLLLHCDALWPCSGHVPMNHDSYLPWYDAQGNGRLCGWYCGKIKDQGKHFQILEQVFERCRKYKLRMNPMKCAFGVSARKFLGFLVHHRSISVDPAKTKAIVTMKRPTTIWELKSFLGRVSYIRRFMPRLASVTSSLSKLLKRGLSSLGELSSRKPFRGSSKLWIIFPPYKHQYMDDPCCYI